MCVYYDLDPPFMYACSAVPIFHLQLIRQIWINVDFVMSVKFCVKMDMLVRTQVKSVLFAYSCDSKFKVRSFVCLKWDKSRGRRNGAQSTFRLVPVLAH